MSITKDEEVCLHAAHTETSISYNLKNQVPRNETLQYGLKNGEFKLTLPPERIAIHGDSEWRHSMFSAITKPVRFKHYLFISLCLSATVYLPPLKISNNNKLEKPFTFLTWMVFFTVTGKS